jgi:glycosyltransferase involved in cell wall biosynthesis
MISVVIPVYRNAETLHALQDRLFAALAAETVEIIFVNDASPDSSFAALRGLAAADGHVMVVNVARNIGQHAAIRLGLRYAQGEIVVIMDADLQDPPEAVPALVAALRSGQPALSAVFATRRGQYHAGPLDWLTGWGFKWLFHALSGRRMPFGAGLFLAMRSDLCRRVVAEAAGYPYLLGFLVRTGLAFGDVPTVRVQRETGRSAYTHWKRLKVAVKALLYTYTPLAGRASPTEPAHHVLGAARHRPQKELNHAE